MNEVYGECIVIISSLHEFDERKEEQRVLTKFTYGHTIHIQIIYPETNHKSKLIILHYQIPLILGCNGCLLFDKIISI